MKKSGQYTYIVGDVKIKDTTAFGEGWQKAKALAEELHVPVYRHVRLIQEWDDVYCDGGIFLDTEHVRPESVHVFGEEV